MPNYKKRSTYQTGGAAKPQPPAGFRIPPRNVPQRPTSQDQYLAQQERERQMQRDRMSAAARRERGLMELGNRQRAAAARARAQRPTFKMPSRAQQARNLAEYNAAMEQRRRASSRGSTPARPRPSPVSAYQQELQNRRIGRPTPTPPPATSINRGNGRASPAIPNPNYRPPVRPNPAPRSRERTMFTQQMQAERQRIINQIAQLQARLKQLGG